MPPLFLLTSCNELKLRTDLNYFLKNGLENTNSGGKKRNLKLLFP